MSVYPCGLSVLFYSITVLALHQTRDCPSAIEANFKDMVKFVCIISAMYFTRQ